MRQIASSQIEHLSNEYNLYCTNKTAITNRTDKFLHACLGSKVALAFKPVFMFLDKMVSFISSALNYSDTVSENNLIL